MTIPNPGRPFHFEQIKQNVWSDKQPIRGWAMETLYLQAKKDSAIHVEALAIFREHLLRWPDYMTSANAARGIELIAGAEEGRVAWLALLRSPEAKLAVDVASLMKDVFYLPVLLEMLERLRDKNSQSALMRALGRMKNPGAYDAIVARLANEELRPHAIEALAELGDVRAVSVLEPLLGDRTEAWEEDNHGPMLRVCDLAKEAIARLRNSL